jgi:TolA-binding protein
MKAIIVLLSIPLLLTSCFKTAEDIQREKRVNQQLDQSSRIIAELTSQITELKGGLASTSGQLEELDHKNIKTKEEHQQTFGQSLSQLAEQMKVISEDNAKVKLELQAIKDEQTKQRKFVKKITGTLSSIASGKPAKSKSNSKLKTAHKAFEKNKLKKAKQLYLELLSSKSVNAAQRNHLYFNLGLMEYWNKKYNDALVYFSKIFSKYPRSSFAPRSLLYIARSFKKLNKADEANESFSVLIRDYPKSKHAKTAKEEMK